ncbi:MAG: LysM peptidoglycan-binding domain-containing protein [Flavipsychrobacter sp.]|nr:LysM peptidoglycan-binding domain-containing protein [Flavipsychrobacter sp.]
MKLYNIILLLFCSLQTYAQYQPYPERAKEYVRKYAAYAIADQKATGVPASITLGQGILETEAGISRLVVEANNHFGIKCKNGWNGPTILHTDDAKNECFKKYANALESYNDHSAHLMRNQRYSILFSYSPTDYARWAHGLKKCGYATNPQYAYQLIKIIEEYRLQEYTYAALDSTYKIRGIIPQEYDITTGVAATNTADTEIRSFVKEEVAANAPTAVVNAPVGTTSVEASAATSDTAIAAPTDTLLTPKGDVLMVNGLKAIYAHKDESLLPYAVKYKIRYAHLLEMNDLPDEPLAFDTYVYLEKKKPTGQKSKHKVREGETLLMVAQEEGIQLKRLAAMNLLKPNEQPVAGTALYLQETASVKPAVKDVIAVYTTAGEQENENTTQQSSNTMVAKPNETEVGFGMGFEAPKEVVAQEKKEQESKAPATTTEISRQPFMKDDPPQPQLRKPATEKEYKKGDKMYIVKRGDTAFSIAKRNGITVAQLLKWNNMEASDLKAGQTIRISE